MEERDRSETMEPKRRRFLKWISAGFVSMWGLGSLWVTASYLTPPKSRRSLTERLLKIGPVEDLPVGRGHLVRHGREPIWVVRVNEEQFVGLAGVCTHMHCVLNMDEGGDSLVCPCHDGAFDMNGNVLKGPAPRSLKRYRVETRMGEIYLHL